MGKKEIIVVSLALIFLVIIINIGIAAPQKITAPNLNKITIAEYKAIDFDTVDLECVQSEFSDKEIKWGALCSSVDVNNGWYQIKRVEVNSRSYAGEYLDCMKRGTEDLCSTKTKALAMQEIRGKVKELREYLTSLKEYFPEEKQSIPLTRNKFDLNRAELNN